MTKKYTLHRPAPIRLYKWLTTSPISEALNSHNEETPNTSTTPQCLTRIRAYCPGPSEIPCLHLAPPWHHLYTEPVLTKWSGSPPPNTLRTWLFLSSTPSTHLGKELRTQGQSHSSKVPKNKQVVNWNHTFSHKPWGFNFLLVLFITPTKKPLWVPCHQWYHKAPPHETGTQWATQQALWYKHISF